MAQFWHSRIEISAREERPVRFREVVEVKTAADKTKKGNSMNAKETKQETYYVIRCKSNGNFWHESLDDFMFYHSFEDSPLVAAPVDQAPGYFEEELKAIEKYLPKGEFDASDFELVKVDVSYTLSPHKA